MAIDTSATTIDSPEAQQEVASVLQRAQNGGRRLLRSNPIAQIDAGLAQASRVAEVAYTSLWDRAQDFLEQFSMAFFLAPIISVLYLLRLFVGNLQNGGFTISFRSFTLKAIPGLKFYDIRRHATGIAFLLLFIFEIILVIIFLKAATDPVTMAKLQLCATFNVTCK